MNEQKGSKISELISRLDSEDWIVREDTLEILGELGKNNQEVTSAVSNILLNDEIPYVRNKAAEILGILEDIAATPALIRCLETDTIEDVRAIVIETLGKLKSTEAVKVIANILVDEKSNWVQEKAIEALSRIGSKEAIAELATILKTNYDIRIIDAIIELLFVMNLEDNLNLLENIRENSTQALTELHNRVIRKLAKEHTIEQLIKILDERNELSYSALKVLEEKASIDAMSVPKIWELFEESEQEETRIAIIKIIGRAKRDDSILRLLDIAYNDKSSSIRAQAIHSLGEFGERTSFAAEQIVDLFLKSSNDWIRFKAIEALGKIKIIPEMRIKELGKILLSEKNYEIRFEIVKTLEKIGNRAVVVEPEILLALKNESKVIIQMQLIKTIGELQNKNKEVLELLQQYFENSKNIFVRIFAILSLGRIGEEQSITYLQEIKKQEKDVDTSRAIEWAIREIKRQKILGFLLNMSPEKTILVSEISEKTSIELGDVIELIEKILQEARKIGFYSSKDGLFRKYEEIDEFIHLMMRSKTKYPKYHTCFECRYPIKIIETICPSCQAEIPKCPICKLPISAEEYIGICERCKIKGHLAHFREWVEANGTCPRCLQPTKVKVISKKTFIEK